MKIKFRYISMIFFLLFLFTEASKINVSKILKLLNINGVAEFMIKNYNGTYIQACPDMSF